MGSTLCFKDEWGIEFRANKFSRDLRPTLLTASSKYGEQALGCPPRNEGEKIFVPVFPSDTSTQKSCKTEEVTIINRIVKRDLHSPKEYLIVYRVSCKKGPDRI